MGFITWIIYLNEAMSICIWSSLLLLALHNWENRDSELLRLGQELGEVIQTLKPGADLLHVWPYMKNPEGGFCREMMSCEADAKWSRKAACTVLITAAALVVHVQRNHTLPTWGTFRWQPAHHILKCFFFSFSGWSWYRKVCNLLMDQIFSL